MMSNGVVLSTDALSKDALHGVVSALHRLRKDGQLCRR